MQDSTMAEDPHQDTQGRLGGLLASIAKWTGALVSLALIVGIVFWSYRLGVRDASDLPVIKAGDGPIRAQPDDPGGARMANQGLEVNQVLGGTTPAGIDGETRLAPGPEGMEPGEEPVAIADEVEAPIALSSLVEDEALSELPQAAFNSDGDLVTSRRPRSRPASLDTSVPPTSEVDRIIAGAQSATGAIGDPPSSDERYVQLGAFTSKEIALEQWRRLSQANADLLGNRENLIQESTSGGRTVYRLRVAGFDGLADAQALCTALKARSVSCIPATGP